MDKPKIRELNLHERLLLEQYINNNNDDINKILAGILMFCLDFGDDKMEKWEHLHTRVAKPDVLKQYLEKIDEKEIKELINEIIKRNEFLKSI